MGISTQTFPLLGQAMEACRVETSRIRMCELGSQYMKVKGTHYGPAKPWFESQGIEHVSFDLNDQFGSIRVDLCDPIDDRYVDAFHIVTNFGTSEHVVSQYRCFENIHRLCKIDGLMLHTVPAPGNWLGHGRYYYPLTFFRELARANHYEALFLDDVEKPGRPGCVLCSALLRKSADRPFMRAEEFDELPLIADADNELVGDYLPDPSRLKELWRRVRNGLHRPATSDEKPDRGP